MKNNKDYISSLLSNNGYIAVNRVLIKVLGLNCAVLIGELCSEYNYYSENDQLTNKEWFYSTVPNIEENTGLNKYFQEESIKILKKNKIIETKVMGMPSKRYFKINFSELEKIFKNTKKNKKNTKKMPKNQGSKPVATKEAKELPPRKQKSAHQGSKTVATKEVKELPPRKQKSVHQESKRVATKEVRECPPRKQHSRQHGGEPVATNNNNNNNKLININNNLILSNKDEMRKDEKTSDFNQKEFNIKEFEWNIGLDNLKKSYIDKPNSKQILESIVQICENVLNSDQKYYIISGAKIKKSDFVERISKLNEDHIRYIVDSLKQNTTKIKNIKAYMLATIYNAPDTIDIYYKNLVNYDMANSFKEKDAFIA